MRQIFIIGPPRSGTTVIAQAISSHPNINIYDEVGFALPLSINVTNFLTNRNLYSNFFEKYKNNVDSVASFTSIMDEIHTNVVWGEKYPDYAEHFGFLKSKFPDSLCIFIMRDPKRVAKSYLNYKDSSSRNRTDYWIKDTPEDAYNLICKSTDVLKQFNLPIIRYEDFMINPIQTLNNLFCTHGITYTVEMLNGIKPLESIETDGGAQFIRKDNVLPWKKGNLSGIKEQKDVDLPEEIYAAEGWKKIEELAKSFGY